MTKAQEIQELRRKLADVDTRRAITEHQCDCALAEVRRLGRRLHLIAQAEISRSLELGAL